MALLTENFFPISNPERFFSSLKKTIVLYLVKKFETFMMIFTSGRRRLFFKKTILYISFTDNPFYTEMQARRYIKIKYYNIHICNFTLYLKKNWKLFIFTFRFILRCFGKMIINLSLIINKNAIWIFVILSITFELLLNLTSSENGQNC